MGEYARKLQARLRGIHPPMKPFTPLISYAKEITPLKGQRDGNCNRTACQAPLAGRPQWTMPNYSTGGLYHYCEVCERDFTAWDRRIDAPIRCTPIIETGAT